MHARNTANLGGLICSSGYYLTFVLDKCATPDGDALQRFKVGLGGL
jgi:hypothetical protein